MGTQGRGPRDGFQQLRGTQGRDPGTTKNPFFSSLQGRFTQGRGPRDGIPGVRGPRDVPSVPGSGPRDEDTMLERSLVAKG